MNRKISTIRPELHPVPVKSPWFHLGMDFIGPVSPPSVSGSRYILTISDYFTLPTKEAANVVHTLRQVYFRCACRYYFQSATSCLQLFFVMGLPSVMTTDQGREFNNSLNMELMRSLNIEHRLTTPYHPQANGLVERFNQTLINSLAKFVQDNRET